MPLYYTDIKIDAHETAIDLEGQVFPDLQAAERDAELSMLEWAKDALKLGMDETYEAIIRDATCERSRTKLHVRCRLNRLD